MDERAADAREWAVVGLVALAVSVVCCGPLFASWSNWGSGDWDQHLAYHAVPYFTVVEYGQFPLWNPYVCGGMAMHANPQARVLSPFFPLHLMFGFLAGIKLEIVIHLFIGLVGGYALGRAVTKSRIGATVSGAVYMLNSMYAHSLALGMTWFLSVAYVPWAFLGFLKSAERPVYLWLTGASFALVFFNGGAYVLGIASLGLAVFAAFESVKRRSTAPLLRLAVSGVLALGLSAVKLFPTVQFLREFPRQIDDYSGYSIVGLATSLFDQRATVSLGITGDGIEGFWRGFSYGADENYMYIGLLAGFLFVVGFWRKHDGRLAWVGLFMTALWLSLGNRVRPSLWGLLHALPIYDSMRVAQRFRIVMMLAVSILCGLGATEAVILVGRRWGARSGIWASFALGSIIFGDLISVNRRVFSESFGVTLAVTERRPEPFRQTGGDPTAMLPAVLKNLGTVHCYETAGVRRRAIPSEAPGYRGEAFLTGTTGHVDITQWTPNRLRLQVDADSAGVVVVNQNAAEGWTVRQGNAITSMGCRGQECFEYPKALIGIRVNPGHSVLDLGYRPRGFVVGVLTTLVSIVVLSLSLWPRSRTWMSRRLGVGRFSRRLADS